MPRDPSVYLDDIRTAATRIASYLEGYDRVSFGKDPKTWNGRRSLACATS